MFVFFFFFLPRNNEICAIQWSYMNWNSTLTSLTLFLDNDHRMTDRGKWANVYCHWPSNKIMPKMGGYGCCCCCSCSCSCCSCRLSLVTTTPYIDFTTYQLLRFQFDTNILHESPQLSQPLTPQEHLFHCFGNIQLLNEAKL